MRNLILAVAVAVATALAFAGSAPAQQTNMISVGDTTLAAGATVKLFPCFSLGGGHIHSSQFYTVANGCIPAGRGYLYSSIGDVRVKIYGGAGIDTSGFTLPGGSSYGSLPICDSVIVLSTSTQSTRVTWGFYR